MTPSAASLLSLFLYHMVLQVVGEVVWGTGAFAACDGKGKQCGARR